MAFAITKVLAYGIEAEEPLNRHYRQYMYLTITAAAADVALDVGSYLTGSLGTFWTAVSGGVAGAGALKAIQDIGTRAENYDGFSGTFANYNQGQTAAAGVYTVALANLTPNITFNAANGPTSYVLKLSWRLMAQTAPVAYFSAG